MTSTTVAFREALRLQRDRCEVYYQWDQRFVAVLKGKVSAATLTQEVEALFIPRFQEISTALRNLQHDIQRGGLGAAEDKDGTTKKLLHSWIDELQALEKDHYQVSVQLAAEFGEHAAPNGCVTCAVGEEAKRSGNLCTNKNGTSTEVRNISLHDVKHCALHSLVPHVEGEVLSPTVASTSDSCTREGAPRIFFVASCADDDDGMCCAEGDEQLSDEDEGKDMILYMKNFTKDCDVKEVRYAPKVVKASCTVWSERMLPIMHQKKMLRANIESLTEEIQCEFADLE